MGNVSRHYLIRRMASRSPSFRRRHPTLVRAVLLLFTFLAASGAGLAYGAWSLVCRGGQCPPVDSLNDYTPRQTSKLYAVDGRFIAELGLERRTLITLDEIPETVRQAFVITEDKRFYGHAGIDWRRVFGALVRDIIARSWDEGFSTITMQLARNVFPERISREKTLVRKIKEAKVAREIESKFDKRKILELYLNQINLGNGAYGVETAAQRYFGKSVRDLNIAEAATLAALPKAPERYNPKRHPDRAIQRRNTVIELMRRNGAITDEEASGAREYPLQLASKTDAGDTRLISWSGSASSSTISLEVSSTSRAARLHHTRPRPSARSERALERSSSESRPGGLAVHNESYEHYSLEASPVRSARKTPRTCRGPSSHWIRATVPFARWSEAATSTTQSSIARRRRCGSRVRRSSRLCTRPLCRMAGRHRTSCRTLRSLSTRVPAHRGGRETTMVASRGRCPCAAACISRRNISLSTRASSSREHDHRQARNSVSRLRFPVSFDLYRSADVYRWK